MTVIVPADAGEAAAFVKLAAEYDGPVYLRLNRSATQAVSQIGERLQIGKGVVRRQGKDITIIACGSMVGRSLQAADMLAGQGVDAGVLDMHTVKPLDNDLILKTVAKTRAVVTAEEHTVIGGLGSAVAELLAQEMPVPQARIGIRDTFTCTGPDPETIMDAYSLGIRDIANAASRVLEKKRK
jgi:transketolase